MAPDAEDPTPSDQADEDLTSQTSAVQYGRPEQQRDTNWLDELATLRTPEEERLTDAQRRLLAMLTARRPRTKTDRSPALFYLPLDGATTSANGFGGDAVRLLGPILGITCRQPQIAGSSVGRAERDLVQNLRMSGLMREQSSP
jgi:hypothetical protein